MDNTTRNFGKWQLRITTLINSQLVENYATIADADEDTDKVISLYKEYCDGMGYKFVSRPAYLFGGYYRDSKGTTYELV